MITLNGINNELKYYALVVFYGKGYFGRNQSNNEIGWLRDYLPQPNILTYAMPNHLDR